jgi:catechol-2,3-dioxygenase
MTPRFVDHIVIVAKDIAETEKFYSVFLGPPSFSADGLVVYQVGDTKLFFRSPGGEWEAADKDRSGLNHFAFGVRTIAELDEFEEILNNAGIKNTMKVGKTGNKDYIWLDDPSGTRIEIYHRPAE